MKLFTTAILIFTLSYSSQAQRELPFYNFDQKSVISEFTSNCAEDPGDVLISLFSDVDRLILNNYKVSYEEEKEIGDHFHNNLDYKFISDSRSRKLTRILKKILPFVERSEVKYQIFLIESDEINAWTIPGGNIYFTTAIYEFTQSDDEIANIIGHEIGHNENRHTAKPIQREKQKQEITNVLGVDVSLFVNLFQFATIAYNQPQEIEADYSGFYLAYKAGYDPKKGLDFWKRMAANETPNSLEKLFRSHPYSNTRYQCGLEYLEKSKMK